MSNMQNNDNDELNVSPNSVTSTPYLSISPDISSSIPDDNDIFWLYNPNILIHSYDIWPTKNMTIIRKYNAISRIIILFTIIGFVATQSYELLIVALISLAAIFYLYYTNNEISESFQSDINLPNGHLNKDLYEIIKPNLDNSTIENPFSNVMVTSTPNKKIAPPSYISNVKDDIKENVLAAIKKCNPDNNDIDKLLSEVGDEIKLDSSLRNFYSTPNTQIPNDQKGFTDFCYNNLSAQKDKKVF